MIGRYELYPDSLAPVFDELDFVVNYILSFRDPQQTLYQIDPFEMRLYVRGEITTKRLTEMMLITSL